MHPACNSTRGFSLLEMMIVMVIAGLMLTLVPPLFTGAVSGTQLKGAARNLAISLRETRNLAVIRNTRQRVLLDLETGHYRVSDDKSRPLPDGVEMSVQTVPGMGDERTAQHVVRFYPDGSSSGETIILSGGNHAYHLRLDWLTGSITITEEFSNDG